MTIPRACRLFPFVLFILCLVVMDGTYSSPISGATQSRHNSALGQLNSLMASLKIESFTSFLDRQHKPRQLKVEESQDNHNKQEIFSIAMKKSMVISNHSSPYHHRRIVGRLQLPNGWGFMLWLEGNKGASEGALYANVFDDRGTEYVKLFMVDENVFSRGTNSTRHQITTFLTDSPTIQFHDGLIFLTYYRKIISSEEYQVCGAIMTFLGKIMKRFCHSVGLQTNKEPKQYFAFPLSDSQVIFFWPTGQEIENLKYDIFDANTGEWSEQFVLYHGVTPKSMQLISLYTGEHCVIVSDPMLHTVFLSRDGRSIIKEYTGLNQMSGDGLQAIRTYHDNIMLFPSYKDNPIVINLYEGTKVIDLGLFKDGRWSVKPLILKDKNILIIITLSIGHGG